MKHIVFTLVFALCPVLVVAQDSPEQAIVVLRDDVLFPKQQSPETRAALAALNAAPEDTVISALLTALRAEEQGTLEYGRVFAAYTLVSSETVRLAVASALAGTLPEETLDPFLLQIAAAADVTELGPVIEAIRTKPNGLGTALAIQLAQRDRSEILQQLEVLSATVPGAWADAVDLQLNRPIGSLRQNYLQRLDKPLQQAPEVQE